MTGNGNAERASVKMSSCRLLLPESAAVSLPWTEIESGLPSVPVLRSEPRSGNDRIGNQGRFCNIVGGVISPVLANLALDGLQRLLAEHFANTPKRQGKSKVHLVRYADDFLITGTSKELLRDRVQPLVAQFLKERGLELSHEKTRITHVEDGFDFLGQNVRRYRCGKVLTKPSSQSVKTFLSKIRETIDNSGSLTAGEMIQRLNQQIKGWTMYHRYAASKRTFTYVDHRIFQMVWRWCRRRHPKKGRKWLKTNYFRQEGHRHWVFTGMLLNQKGQGRPIQLMAAAGVKIIRYVKIRSAVNPYDPKWELYLEARLGWQLAQTLGGRSPGPAHTKWLFQ